MGEENVLPLQTYSCLVTEVFSGDDLVALVDLGVESLWKRQRIRLYGVDTPNAVKMADDTEAGRIRSLVRGIVRNRRGLLTVYQRNSASWVCGLVVEADQSHNGAINLNSWLIDKGYVFNRKV